MDILPVLKDKPASDIMFRNTCFGRWLDIDMVDRDPLLLHYVFYHEVITGPRREVDGMIFEIESYEIFFGNKEFCLLTNFHFGDYFPIFIFDTTF